MANDAFTVVTGASSGIGRATALALAEAGHNLVLGYGTGLGRIERLAEDLRAIEDIRVFTLQLDLEDPEAAIESVLRSTEGLGEITCLVNNAGINDRTPARSLPVARAYKLLTVNTVAPLALASAVGNRMIEAGTSGTIVNITSIHDSVPITGGALYCASKAALAASTKVLALEFAPHGIRVNCVAPGETATAMNGVDDESTYAAIARPSIPLRRPGGVHEVAAAAAFLAGPASSYLTGSTITVDGGLVLTAAEENARHGGYHSVHAGMTKGSA